MIPEPCEEDDDAEAGSPDFEPGTEIDQGLSNPYAIFCCDFYLFFTPLERLRRYLFYSLIGNTSPCVSI